VQLLHDGAADQRRIGERLERNKRHAIRELVCHGIGRGERKGCLAHTAGPGQRHETDVWLNQE
jgi:hypothetical protein